MTREDAFSIAFANYGDLYLGLYRYRLGFHTCTQHAQGASSRGRKRGGVKIGIGYWFSFTGDLFQICEQRESIPLNDFRARAAQRGVDRDALGPADGKRGTYDLWLCQFY